MLNELSNHKKKNKKKQQKTPKDVDIQVAIQCANVLSYCVDDNVTNQQHVSTRGGMSILCEVLRFCLAWKTSSQQRKKNDGNDGNDGNDSATKVDQDMDQDMDVSNPYSVGYRYDHVYRYDAVALGELLENVSGALSNLAFRNQTNQDEMRRNGTLNLCFSALCGRVGMEREFQGLQSVAKVRGVFSFGFVVVHWFVLLCTGLFCCALDCSHIFFTILPFYHSTTTTKSCWNNAETKPDGITEKKGKGENEGIEGSTPPAVPRAFTKTLLCC
jgi:hypothetical protein|tara:strand:+ start:741 stop:1556 length:816 start_codon:yes stop_codon:yes gene_type:complete